MIGASIETTRELWASSLREVKKRIRPLFASMGSAISSGTYAKPVKAMYSASIPIIGLHHGASRNGLSAPPRRSQRRSDDLTGGVCRPVPEPKDRLARHARLRHDGCHPTSGQQADAQKNQVERNAKTSDLIPWSIQEIRRIAQRLARKRIQPADVIAWSLWRRAHQAAGAACHGSPNVAIRLPAGPGSKGLGEGVVAGRALLHRQDGTAVVGVDDRDVEPRTVLEQLHVALHRATTRAAPSRDPRSVVSGSANRRGAEAGARVEVEVRTIAS